MLTGDGKLCLVGLGRGPSCLPRILTTLWERVWQCRPEWVGGCRPVDLRMGENWSIDHDSAVVSLGIALEVLVASNVTQQPPLPGTRNSRVPLDQALAATLAEREP
jgi:hypothetical protein